ncbi:MAG: hypothetical protein AUJ49_05490 [Desulfovibrionaceae bacterium CG1_02_65_16]|nr:MAG: hypothetical protein AUJ49_05490 [Desulfovibrionaceae bacterium CG1_02_65_16]
MRLVPKILLQSLAILAVSAVLALGVNFIRPDGPAPVFAAPSVVQLSKNGGEIGLKDAAMLFITGRAVFLDARSQFEYQLGHVQGAISLPPREFASQYQDIKPRLAGKEAVITYCDGERCPLSHSLAKYLREAGVKNVYVLVNGWSLWLAEKLPIAKGAAAPMSSAAPAASGTSAAPGKSAGRGGICRDCENK